MNAPVIDRPNISEEVAAALREMIFRGELVGGASVNEAQLVSRLGVSRTPLREALAMLVAERAIDHFPRRGFFVRPLSAEEATEIYALRPILEPPALRLAGLPSGADLDELRAINGRLAEAKDSWAAIQLDDEWHSKLICRCPNRTLIEMIEHVTRRTHRYELAVMGPRQILSSSVQRHREILDALGKGDLEEGCELLKSNVTDGLDPVLRWLANR